MLLLHCQISYDEQALLSDFFFFLILIHPFPLSFISYLPAGLDRVNLKSQVFQIYLTSGQLFSVATTPVQGPVISFQGN